MEKIMDSFYGVIIFYLIIMLLSFFVVFSIKKNQDYDDGTKNTYVAYLETANTDL